MNRSTAPSVEAFILAVIAEVERRQSQGVGEGYRRPQAEDMLTEGAAPCPLMSPHG